jgi:hypothetical protein
MRLKQITDAERSPDSFNVESVSHTLQPSSIANKSNKVYSRFMVPSRMRQKPGQSLRLESAGSKICFNRIYLKQEF